jgi:shikimate dehydrogenase
MTPRSFLSTLTGSFATPAAENPTVAMVEAAYRHHGIDARYLNCDVSPADLADAVRGARAMRWAGFNCSLPHKVAVTGLLDDLAESARIIGAVNCAVRRGDRLVGENTDGRGFLQALTTVIDPAGQSIVILGAGGAARAIAVETALAGAATVTIVNRGPARGEDLVRLLRAHTAASATYVRWEGTYAVPADATVVVNATSVGLYPDVDAHLDVDPASLDPSMVVCDVIPNPPRTQFLRDAERRGCRTLDGLGMLVNQGAVAIELWTGVTPDREVMRAALTDIFGAPAA